MATKTAVSDHPIHSLIAERFSPYGFDSRPVKTDELRSLFEAARWAPSSYNEQPWSYIVATIDDPDEFRAWSMRTRPGPAPRRCWRWG
jgi:nitroreductase